MSEKAARQPEMDATKATAHLPGLDIEIVHRFTPGGDAEQISIHLQAMPSFEAFGRFLEASNPLAFWGEVARLAWSPWFEVARAMQPWSFVPLLPKFGSEARSRSAEESRSS